ncbi:surfeit locus protein 1 isoform X2 [Cicer arietinum]|uniref:SURF1-like protein n=1 Tax=Cicer arietinum TaxID=3827 RepID=A0A1S3EGZ5_CICAR|nr:surfeit locus protein 1 isoform X2 [Cicer arietinum]
MCTCTHQVSPHKPSLSTILHLSLFSLTSIFPMPPSASAARTLAELRRIATLTRSVSSSGNFLSLRPFSSAATVSNSDPTFSSSSDSNGSKWLLFVPGAIAFGLGSWQIVRREEKIKMLEYRGKRLEIEPLKLGSTYPSSEELDSLEFRKVVSKGVFDEKKSIYVGPRSRSISGVTENGYYVITPLMPVHNHPDSVGFPILVNRGWVPRSWKEKFLEASHDEKFADPLPSPSQADGTGSWWRFWSKEPVRSEDPVPSVTPKEVVGVVRGSEKPSIFVPANDPEASQWFYIDVPSIARACGLPENTIYVEDINENVNPSNPYPVPKDVNTLIRFSVMPQDHVNYILTWYSLSAAVTFMAFKRLTQKIKRR